MNKPVISVENLSKAYRIGVKDEAPDTLVGAMTGVIRAPLKNFNRLRKLDTFSGSPGDAHSEDTLWALNDVSFDVQEGEVVGIIGRNGAGKSTLLKILSRITDPTSGRAVIRGRVSSLLEVGTGFHPELSGRDNIYMNGTILGMTKREVDRKFDEIVDFSGVEKFLDTPVKRYSSGMQVRLAFSVAAHLEPEVLVIDEVLAVGDMEFQNRCLGRMRDVAQSGRTVLFVSHNLEAVKALCSRVILLKDGSVWANGSPEKYIPSYIRSMKENTESNLESRTDRIGSGAVKLINFTWKDGSGNSVDSVSVGDELWSCLEFGMENSFSRLSHIGIDCFCEDGTKAFHIDSNMKNHALSQLKSHRKIYVNFPRIPLTPGDYHIDVRVFVDRSLADRLEGVAMLRVLNGDFYGTGSITKARGGAVLIDHEWRLPQHWHE